MKIQVTSEAQYTLLRPEAEKLDSSVSPLLKAEIVMLNGKGVKNLLIDLTDVKYIDSSGLSAILVANRLCKSLDGVMVLAGLSENVKKLIAISQLESILTIVPTAGEGIEFIIMDDIEKNISE